MMGLGIRAGPSPFLYPTARNRPTIYRSCSHILEEKPVATDYIYGEVIRANQLQPGHEFIWSSDPEELAGSHPCADGCIVRVKDATVSENINPDFPPYVSCQIAHPKLDWINVSFSSKDEIQLVVPRQHFPTGYLSSQNSRSASRSASRYGQEAEELVEDEAELIEDEDTEDAEAELLEDEEAVLEEDSEDSAEEVEDLEDLLDMLEDFGEEMLEKEGEDAELLEDEEDAEEILEEEDCDLLDLLDDFEEIEVDD